MQECEQAFIRTCSHICFGIHGEGNVWVECSVCERNGARESVFVCVCVHMYVYKCVPGIYRVSGGHHCQITNVK